MNNEHKTTLQKVMESPGFPETAMKAINSLMICGRRALTVYAGMQFYMLKDKIPHTVQDVMLGADGKALIRTMMPKDVQLPVNAMGDVKAHQVAGWLPGTVGLGMKVVAKNKREQSCKGIVYYITEQKPHRLIYIDSTIDNTNIGFKFLECHVHEYAAVAQITKFGAN